MIATCHIGTIDPDNLFFSIRKNNTLKFFVYL